MFRLLLRLVVQENVRVVCWNRSLYRILISVENCIILIRRLMQVLGAATCQYSLLSCTQVAGVDHWFIPCTHFLGHKLDAELLIGHQRHALKVRA